MDEVSRVRWERLLLVIAALFGVVAMHSMVGPSHGGHLPTPAALSVVSSPVTVDVHAHGETTALPDHDQAAAPITTLDGSDHGPTSPMSMPHALMHLCLAVMAAGIVLGLLAVVLLAVLPGERVLVASSPHADVRPARPPLPTGARLAQLCVLRN